MAVAALAVLVLAGCSQGQGTRCEVMDAASTAEADALRESCERAVPTIEELWPAWTGDVPIVVSTSELAPGVAAQVEGRAVSHHPAEEDRVLVGAGVVAQLSPEGLDLVMRHELTHLAMRSTGTAPIPLWASEGLAEWIGYQGVTDERSERAADLQALEAAVSEGRWTRPLPGPAELGNNETRADAYTAAWLAVSILVDEVGLHDVTDAMRPTGGTASDGNGTRESEQPRSADDVALTQGFLQRVGISREWLEERWHTELALRAAVG